MVGEFDPDFLQLKQVIFCYEQRFLLFTQTSQKNRNIQNMKVIYRQRGIQKAVESTSSKKKGRYTNEHKNTYDIL